MTPDPTAEQPATEADRYTRSSILRSERMYGPGFQGPADTGLLESFCRRAGLRPGMRVLDIGCGLGGAAFHLAERHGATVRRDEAELSSSSPLSF